ncbi:MAG: DNA mismatch repair protein [Microbacterium sp.]
MTLIDMQTSREVRGLTLRAVSDSRSRLLDRAGRILGHVRTEPTNAGARFHAEHFDPARRRLREVGAFWSLDEAVECLRYLR